MASEKVRKEIKEEGKMSVYFRVLLGASIVQLAVALGAFMSVSVDTMLLVFLGITSLAMLLVSVFMWDTVTAFRRTVRGVLMALVGGLLVFGIGCAVYTASFAPSVDAAMNLSASTADTDVGYIFLFDMAVVSTFAQLIVSFFMPMMVAGASTHRTFDRVLLCVFSTLHAAMIAFMVFCTSQSGIGMPVWNTEDTVMPTWMLSESIEITLVQVIVLAISVIFAGMTYVPLFSKKK